MKHLITFDAQIQKLLSVIIESSDRHAKWLNTLSFLENCGARKIAACEHPTLVKEEMLKHAAEEFRHAHYLKRQIEKVSQIPLRSYALKEILGGSATIHYVNTLDVQVSRYLMEQGFVRGALKEAAYLLVTYAIEVRASELYPIYDDILRKRESKVTVKSILLEEKEHLKEMEMGIAQLFCGVKHCEKICSIEGSICKKWLEAIARECL